MTLKQSFKSSFHTSQDLNKFETLKFWSCLDDLQTPKLVSSENIIVLYTTYTVSLNIQEETCMTQLSTELGQDHVRSYRTQHLLERLLFFMDNIPRWPMLTLDGRKVHNLTLQSNEALSSSGLLSTKIHLNYFPFSNNKHLLIFFWG